MSVAIDLLAACVHVSQSARASVAFAYVTVCDVSHVCVACGHTLKTGLG